MLYKFTIDYARHPRSQEPAGTHRTNDPVEAEEYIMQLLHARSCILSIKHEGVDLPRPQFDQMLKVAGERLLTESLCHALDIDTAEVRHRFGFAA
ncbi:MAG: hypothetical protein P4L99_27400 [Chthoniobacter sp.]|nr:hypothetical protein [Chthoniobacter sp.]